MKSRSEEKRKAGTDSGKRKRVTGRILHRETLAVLVVILLIVVMQACQSSNFGTSSDMEITVYKTGYCFDTVITLTAYTSQTKSETASQILEDALLLCQEYEAKYLDRFDLESEVGAINAAQRQKVELSDICRDLVEAGLYYYELSDGAFDLTIAPLSDLWNVTDEDFTVPTEEQIAEAKTLVGSDRVTLSGNTLTLGEGQQLNFGGIAKGYMCEALRQYFTENGLSHVIVNLGGNVFVMGREEGYTVAVANPLSEDYAATVSISDGYVVTSGIYERGQEIDGVWYHHIIDPVTGYPVDTEIVSATVVMDTSDHPDSAVAWHSDALSTMFVLAKTQEDADDLWQRLKADENYDVLSQVILIMEDGTVTVLNESDE